MDCSARKIKPDVAWLTCRLEEARLNVALRNVEIRKSLRCLRRLTHFAQRYLLCDELDNSAP